MSNNFYIFSSKLISSTIQAHPINLNKNKVENDLFDEFKLIKADYSGISFPVVFKQKYGKRFMDILDTGWPNLYLISTRLKDILEENDLSGWKTFGIELFDKANQKINGYHGFSITGQCGPIDYSRSEIFQKQISINGPFSTYYKGLFFENWDGSDFFLPKNVFEILITERTAEILKINKITNVNLEKVSDCEVDSYTVESTRNNS